MRSTAFRGVESQAKVSEILTQVKELCRLRDRSTMDERLIAKIELLADLFVGIAGDGSRSQLEAEDALILDMERG